MGLWRRIIHGEWYIGQRFGESFATGIKAGIETAKENEFEIVPDREGFSLWHNKSTCETPFVKGFDSIEDVSTLLHFIEEHCCNEATNG